jgi:hypothetical protein
MYNYRSMKRPRELWAASRGYGFVQMRTQEEAAIAIAALDGTTLPGCMHNRLVVQYVQV